MFLLDHAPIKRPKRYRRHGAEPVDKACNIPRSTLNMWLMTTGEQSQIVETPSSARAAEINADSDSNIDEDNRVIIHHYIIHTSCMTFFQELCGIAFEILFFQ